MDLNLFRGTAGADLFQVFWDRGRDAYCIVSGGEVKLSGTPMEIVLAAGESENELTETKERHLSFVVTVGETFRYSKDVGPHDIERHDLMQKAGNHVLHLERQIAELNQRCGNYEERLAELNTEIALREGKVGELSRELHDERQRRIVMEPYFDKAQTVRGSLSLLMHHARNLLVRLSRKPPG